MHTYNIPEVIALPIVDCSEDYLKWLAKDGGDLRYKVVIYSFHPPVRKGKEVMNKHHYQRNSFDDQGRFFVKIWFAFKLFGLHCVVPPFYCCYYNTTLVRPQYGIQGRIVISALDQVVT